MKMNEAGPPPGARLLGAAGLIPFVGLAAALWLVPPGDRPAISMALLGYGAVIVSFLGAVHWGVVMRENLAQPLSSLIWGVSPSLLGWVALLLGHAPGLLLIAVLLWACLVADRLLYPRYQLRAWLPLRLWLTVVASGSSLAGAVALLR